MNADKRDKQLFYLMYLSKNQCSSVSICGEYFFRKFLRSNKKSREPVGFGTGFPFGSVSSRGRFVGRACSDGGGLSSCERVEDGFHTGRDYTGQEEFWGGRILRVVDINHLNLFVK
jgi:hypothetical protein